MDLFKGGGGARACPSWGVDGPANYLVQTPVRASWAVFQTTGYRIVIIICLGTLCNYQKYFQTINQVMLELHSRLYARAIHTAI